MRSLMHSLIFRSHMLFTVLLCFFFFFSSRRRHTRFDCDWSSDVCSSDLLWQVREAGLGATAHIPGKPDTFEGWEDSAVAGSGERRVGEEGRSRWWPDY